MYILFSSEHQSYLFYSAWHVDDEVIGKCLFVRTTGCRNGIDSRFDVFFFFEVFFLSRHGFLFVLDGLSPSQDGLFDLLNLLIWEFFLLVVNNVILLMWLFYLIFFKTTFHRKRLERG